MGCSASVTEPSSLNASGFTEKPKKRRHREKGRSSSTINRLPSDADGGAGQRETVGDSNEDNDFVNVIPTSRRSKKRDGSSKKKGKRHGKNELKQDHSSGNSLALHVMVQAAEKSTASGDNNTSTSQHRSSKSSSNSSRGTATTKAPSTTSAASALRRRPAEQQGENIIDRQEDSNNRSGHHQPSSRLAPLSLSTDTVFGGFRGSKESTSAVGGSTGQVHHVVIVDRNENSFLNGEQEKHQGTTPSAPVPPTDPLPRARATNPRNGLSPVPPVSERFDSLPLKPLNPLAPRGDDGFVRNESGLGPNGIASAPQPQRQPSSHRSSGDSGTLSSTGRSDDELYCLRDFTKTETTSARSSTGNLRSAPNSDKAAALGTAPLRREPSSSRVQPPAVPSRGSGTTISSGTRAGEPQVRSPNHQGVSRSIHVDQPAVSVEDVQGKGTLLTEAQRAEQLQAREVLTRILYRLGANSSTEPNSPTFPKLPPSSSPSHSFSRGVDGSKQFSLNTSASCLGISASDPESDVSKDLPSRPLTQSSSSDIPSTGLQSPASASTSRASGNSSPRQGSGRVVVCGPAGTPEAKVEAAIRHTSQVLRKSASQSRSGSPTGANHFNNLQRISSSGRSGSSMRDHPSTATATTSDVDGTINARSPTGGPRLGQPTPPGSHYVARVGFESPPPNANPPSGQASSASAKNSQEFHFAVVSEDNYRRWSSSTSLTAGADRQLSDTSPQQDVVVIGGRPPLPSLQEDYIDPNVADFHVLDSAA